MATSTSSSKRWSSRVALSAHQLSIVPLFLLITDYVSTLPARFVTRFVAKFDRIDLPFRREAIALSPPALPLPRRSRSRLVAERISPDSGRSRSRQTLAPTKGRLRLLSAFMSASLIGRFGSSAFRLSITTVSMSLAGSCFSSDSYQGPSIMGSEDEAEQSFGRPCRLADSRSKQTYELASSIVPRGTSFHRLVELECPPYPV